MSETDSDEQFADTVTPPRTTTNIRVKMLQRDNLVGRALHLRKNIPHFSSMSYYQLETKLAVVEHHFSVFEKVQLELESLDESQIDLEHRTLFEDSYCDVKSAILERMADLNKVDTLNSTTMTMPAIHPTSAHRQSLPKLQLTKFSGNYTEWLDFYNMFNALVHSNVGLSDIEKFQYLRSCLTQGAFRLIQSLEVTSENYRRAVDLLLNRYDNKRYIFQSHVQAMFDCRSFKASSASSLREFIDSVNSHLRALQSLATRTQVSDGILLHFIVAKLDPEIQVKWEEYVSTKWDNASSTSLHIPTWDDLATFIERRCHTVNIIEVNRKSTTKVASGTKLSPSPKPSTVLVSLLTNKCLLCNEAVTHSPFKCEKFNAMDPMQRYSVAKKNHLCLNCLGLGHSSSKCPSFNRCQHCKVSHHTLLHRSDSTPSSTSTSLNVTADTGEIILATALVQLCTDRGTKLIAKALLDSASQLNFMTERSAQLLQLKRTKIDLEISGIGALTTKS